VLANQRVLVIIPDLTRSAPIPLLFRLLYEVLGKQVARLDYLIALGTHSPLEGVLEFTFSSQTGQSHLPNYRKPTQTHGYVGAFQGVIAPSQRPEKPKSIS